MKRLSKDFGLEGIGYLSMIWLQIQGARLNKIGLIFKINTSSFSSYLGYSITSRISKLLRK